MCTIVSYYALDANDRVAHCHSGGRVLRAGAFFENLVVCMRGIAAGRRNGTFVPLVRSGRGGDRSAVAPPLWGL
jgi:hypothetical protein